MSKKTSKTTKTAKATKKTAAKTVSKSGKKSERRVLPAKQDKVVLTPAKQSAVSEREESDLKRWLHVCSTTGAQPTDPVFSRFQIVSIRILQVGKEP